MSPFAGFLEDLLTRGKVVLRARPRAEADAEAVAFLRTAYEDYQLDVAGPPLAFDEPAAVWAAGLVWQACWFLHSRVEPAAEVEQCLAVPRGRPTPAAHLSADLTLRFLAQVHSRARLLDSTDRLTVRLTEILRAWPLSGVLSDVEEGPAEPPDFDDHPGLLLLYAERLAEGEKPLWLPAEAGVPYVELVWREVGLDPTAFLRAVEGAREAGASRE